MDRQEKEELVERAERVKWALWERMIEQLTAPQQVLLYLYEQVRVALEGVTRGARAPNPLPEEEWWAELAGQVCQVEQLVA